jgi:hypothetical protein
VTVRRRRYVSLRAVAVLDARRALDSRHPATVRDALLRLSIHGPDFALAERLAFRYAFHPDPWMRRSAALVWSNVARARGLVDTDLAMNTLIGLLLYDPEVSGWADGALDDLEVCLGADRRLYFTPAASLGAEPRS